MKPIFRIIVCVLVTMMMVQSVLAAEGDTFPWTYDSTATVIHLPIEGTSDFVEASYDEFAQVEELDAQVDAEYRHRGEIRRDGGDGHIAHKI